MPNGKLNLCVTFCICVLIFAYSTVGSNEWRTYCYLNQKNYCFETNVTYGGLCFKDLNKCTEIIRNPNDQLWYFDWEKSKDDCLQYSKWNKHEKIFPTYFSTKANCNKAYNAVKKRMACTNDTIKKCRKIVYPQFIYNAVKGICQISKRPLRYSSRYQTYKRCRLDNGARYCIEPSSKQCFYCKTKHCPAKLCFYHQSDCSIHSEWMRNIWYYKDSIKQCVKTLPKLKQSHLKYFPSQQKCEEGGYCFTMKDGKCNARFSGAACDPLKFRFQHKHDCEECLMNYGNQWYIIHNYDCKITDLEHEYKQIFCSVYQCNARKKIALAKADTSVHGGYLLRYQCKNELSGHFLDHLNMFKTKEECLQRLNIEKDYQKKMVAYKKRKGWCEPTMNLNEGKIYSSMAECKASYGPMIWTNYKYVSTCEGRTLTDQDRKLGQKYRWFDSVDECKAYVADAKKNRPITDILGQ